MRWTDTLEIALALEDIYGSVDILSLRFTDLKKMVMELPEFSDDPSRCNEKILEAIQMMWVKERD